MPSATKQYKKAIKTMKEKGITSLRNSGVKLLSYPGSSGKTEYLVIELNKILGEGNFGKVFQGHRIDEEGKPLCNAKGVPLPPLAIKEFHEKPESKPIETDFFNKLYWSTYIEDDHQAYLVMEKLPGKNLGSEAFKTLEEQLTLGERLNLITQLFLGLNTISHEKIGAKAFLHRDIKPANILIEKIEKQPHAELHAALVDFGLSKAIDAEDLEVPVSMNGSPGYVPPEVTSNMPAQGLVSPYTRVGTLGVKGDVYALTGAILRILGVKNELGLKNHQSGSGVINDDHYLKCTNFKKMINTPFNRTGLLLTFHGLPPELDCMQALITKFLDRMEDPDPKTRASSDEGLKFFNALHNLYNIHAYMRNFNSEIPAQKKQLAVCKEQFNVYLTQAVILAEGAWNQPLKGNSSSNKRTLGTFDFAGNKAFCKKACQDYRAGRLSTKQLVERANKAEQQAIEASLQPDHAQRVLGMLARVDLKLERDVQKNDPVMSANVLRKRELFVAAALPVLLNYEAIKKNLYIAGKEDAYTGRFFGSYGYSNKEKLAAIQWLILAVKTGDRAVLSKNTLAVLNQGTTKKFAAPFLQYLNNVPKGLPKILAHRDFREFMGIDLHQSRKAAIKAAKKEGMTPHKIALLLLRAAKYKATDFKGAINALSQSEIDDTVILHAAKSLGISQQAKAELLSQNNGEERQAPRV